MKRKTISDIGEFGFIARLGRDLSNSPDALCGVGDDAAVIDRGEGGKLMLLTTDTVVENVHFRSDTAPYEVGWKAMAVNVSDIAAMGGLPKHAVVALTAPGNIEIDYLDELYRGMVAVADLYGVVIVGGDTTGTKGDLTITVTLTGEVERDRVALRSAARKGDVVCVTGSLGGSLREKHLRFRPLVAEARFIVKNFSPIAMIDISDGLASDIGHIVEESGVGARLFAEKIPVSDAAREQAGDNMEAALSHALFDGEDFELLIAMNPQNAKKASAEFKKRFGVFLSVIGSITAESGKVVMAHPDGTEENLARGGYDHFKEEH